MLTIRYSPTNINEIVRKKEQEQQTRLAVGDSIVLG